MKKKEEKVMTYNPILVAITFDWQSFCNALGQYTHSALTNFQDSIVGCSLATLF